MSPEPTILSIQVGRPQQYDADGGSGAACRPWISSIEKQRVDGPVFVDFTNLAGDQQSDLKHHGGVEKAVLGYAASHYAAWKIDLPAVEFSFGAFGENLTIAGLEETTCCVGDVVEIGKCRLQISQPRQPCWKLSRRWNLAELAAIVQKTGRTGWYYRVLAPGVIEAGMSLRLVDRPFPEITVAGASAVMHAQPHRRDQDLALAACPALSESWRKTLTDRATKGEEPDVRRRLLGRAASG